MTAIPEEFLTEKGEHKLNDTWILWRHTKASTDWTIAGYDKIATITTVEEFWRIYNDLPSLTTEDMWFLMRKGVPPIWEDQINRAGGAFKFRIHRKHADATWLTLSMFLIGEEICRTPKDAELISGLSISPKGNVVTLSIWNLDKSRIGVAIFPTNIPGIDFSTSLYEPHSNRCS